MTTDLPLSVWLTGQRPSRAQRGDRYVPASVAHPGKMMPAIATKAITDYTAPGDLVLDPMCGIGTTLVEAVHLGRDAVGVEYEAPWAQLARRNLHHARTQGATGTGTVHCGDARQLDTVLDPKLTGQVALVLTSPPYGSSLHGQVTPRPGAGVEKRDYRYSRDRTNLAHVGLDRLIDGMVTIAASCATLAATRRDSRDDRPPVLAPRRPRRPARATHVRDHRSDRAVPVRAQHRAPGRRPRRHPASPAGPFSNSTKSAKPERKGFLDTCSPTKTSSCSGAPTFLRPRTPSSRRPRPHDHATARPVPAGQPR